MPNASILSVLRDRAGESPDDRAFTFTDYDRDPDGVSETLTWAQLYRRTLNMADQVSQYGSPGDRALIVAPQGLPYIVAFLGAMQAGFIAVPLSAPVPGSHDERTSAVVADTSPSVVLTTAALFDVATQYVDDGAAMTAVISVDTLDLDGPEPADTEVPDGPDIAYLQYTSGSTRAPAGVMISHRNLIANFDQLMPDYLRAHGGAFPPGTGLVSWLPFYHDMGLMLGVAAPILGGREADLMSPLAFLTHPARWLKAMSRHKFVVTGGPNFALDLTSRRTTDADLEGVELSGVESIICGAERVHPPTVARFNERFGPSGFRPEALMPSYGLAEATVFVASGAMGRAPVAVEFGVEQLTEGRAVREPGGTPLLRYGVPPSPLLLIVDTDTGRPCPDGAVGEIWTHGENVSAGYWRKPDQTGTGFGATLVDGPADLPSTDWLRTGDRGFVSEGDLFIVGRIKDMLIVRGRNHYSEDIEETVREITRGRVAAIAVAEDHSEKLVTIVEFKQRADEDLDVVKSNVTAAISRAHGLQVAEILLVAPGSIPTTTSGKIRRAACIEQHRQGQFVRLDV